MAKTQSKDKTPERVSPQTRLHQRADEIQAYGTVSHLRYCVVDALAIRDQFDKQAILRRCSFILASALSRPWPCGRCCVAAESFQSLATPRLRVARCENQSELCRSGFTATDLNQHRGYQTVEQGASEAVRLAFLPADGRLEGSSPLPAAILGRHPDLSFSHLVA